MKKTIKNILLVFLGLVIAVFLGYCLFTCGRV